jgi:uncharacterized protein (DUF433 family)
MGGLVRRRRPPSENAKPIAACNAMTVGVEVARLRGAITSLYRCRTCCRLPRTKHDDENEVPMRIERISHDPAEMGGKPCIRGLRVTVGMILGLLATGQTRERILQAYPYLEPEDIDAALAYAAWRLEEREEPLVVT